MVDRDEVSRNEGVDPRPRAVDIGRDLLGAAQPGVVSCLVYLPSKQFGGALSDLLDEVVGDVEVYGTRLFWMGRRSGRIVGELLSKTRTP